MKKSVIWIVAALTLFALGYVGHGMYEAHRQQKAQSVTPNLPKG